jgi:endonuclease YncB( thermonuclease family)
MAGHSGIPRQRVAAMGERSKQFAESLCRGATHVRLEFDPANAPAHRDKYNRLLVYIFLTPKSAQREVFLNAEEVRQGYARAYTTYRFRYARDFTTYESEARANKRGLWRLGTLP